MERYFNGTNTYSKRRDVILIMTDRQGMQENMQCNCDQLYRGLNEFRFTFYHMERMVDLTIFQLVYLLCYFSNFPDAYRMQHMAMDMGMSNIFAIMTIFHTCKRIS